MLLLGRDKSGAIECWWLNFDKFKWIGCELKIEKWKRQIYLKR